MEESDQESSAKEWMVAAFQKSLEVFQMCCQGRTGHRLGSHHETKRRDCKVASLMVQITLFLVNMCSKFHPVYVTLHLEPLIIQIWVLANPYPNHTPHTQSDHTYMFITCSC